MDILDPLQRLDEIRRLDPCPSVGRFDQPAPCRQAVLVCRIFVAVQQMIDRLFAFPVESTQRLSCRMPAEIRACTAIATPRTAIARDDAEERLCRCSIESGQQSVVHEA
jgi:hypothetical protein